MTISQTNLDRLPTRLDMAGDSYGPIIRVDSDRLLEAVNRLLAANGEVDGVRSERFIAFSRTNRVRLDAMWSRLDANQRIKHTVLAVPNPGRTAMMFATRPARKRDVAPLADLIDHACCMIGDEDVHLCQALLDPAEVFEQEVFVAGGFSELARLSYLERTLPRRQYRKSSVHWPDGVSIEPYNDDLESDLMGVLDASYEDTLDCPGLRGLRETRDILEGHKATGAFEADLWTILKVEGQPAGALLLNPSPQHRSVELVYIGLAKFARGRGLATLLLRHGLSLLAGRPERTITLAVDDRNAPAHALYRSTGFRRVLRRVANIRITKTKQRAS